MQDRWTSAEAYERYVGRWSAPVADRFLTWLGIPPGCDWLDVGCGTGSLSAQILASAAPSSLIGVDPSPAFVTAAAGRLAGRDARFAEGRADDLPADDHSLDVVVSGLVINFVPDVAAALAEARRVTRSGGRIAAYVWDYAGRMDLIRRFWDAAVALDPAATDLDEGRRFPLCDPDRLRAAWDDAGLTDIEVRAIDVDTRFVDFDDYWWPFETDVGPAPGYASSLSEGRRAELRERLRTALPTGSDGSIDLIARAWAVQGRA